jgi:Phage integrase family
VWEQDGRTKVGLPPGRLHDVRHSYATAALAADIPAKIISERLGHANVQITLDTYSHVIPGLDEQAAATVARLILDGSDTASSGALGSDAASAGRSREQAVSRLRILVRRSRTPPALRSSATRDRSAGRARQGRSQPRPGFRGSPSVSQ